jgi:hypothetical protein
VIFPDPRLLGSLTPSPAPAGEGRGPRGASNHRALWLLAAALLCPSIAPQPAGADPFADEVVSFEPGERAGFGADQMPGIVLGPPRGGGDQQGSLDVVSLGDGGVIVVAFRDGVICDGPGPDFTVFENAFIGGGTTVFAEVGIVAVSADGESFVEFPYDPATFEGLAGTKPVYSHPDNGIDPTDPSVSGGDHFDLADLGMSHAVYVRITDPGAAIPDPGNFVPPGNSAGFDLDAIAAVHPCDTPPPLATATPSGSPTPTADGPTPTPSSTRRTTPTGTPTRTAKPATPIETALRGDANGDGVVDALDIGHAIAEIFDGDGDLAGDAGGGRVASSPGVDRNQDGRISVADLLP